MQTQQLRTGPKMLFCPRDRDLSLAGAALRLKKLGNQQVRLVKLSHQTYPTFSVGYVLSLMPEVGDRVTYEVFGPTVERHTVQLVDGASNLRHGILNDATPLAQALLGLCEGDEAVLNVPGKAGLSLRVIRIVREVAAEVEVVGR